MYAIVYGRVELAVEYDRQSGPIYYDPIHYGNYVGVVYCSRRLFQQSDGRQGQ